MAGRSVETVVVRRSKLSKKGPGSALMGQEPKHASSDEHFPSWYGCRTILAYASQPTGPMSTGSGPEQGSPLVLLPRMSSGVDPTDRRGLPCFLPIFVEKGLAIPELIGAYWNKARETTPTKARLTSEKDP